jgi:hypothetical protein
MVQETEKKLKEKSKQERNRIKINKSEGATSS